MSLLPSRRLPRAFRRSPSRFMLRLAHRHARRRRGLRSELAALGRHWRRGQRSLLLVLGSFRLVCIGAAAIALLIAIAYVLFSPRFTVQSIRVEREDQRVDVEEIQQLLLPYFSRHLFFLSPHAVGRSVRRAYPEVSEVRVQKRYPSELQVSIAVDPIISVVRLGEPDETEAALSGTGSFLAEDGTYRYLTSKGVYLEEPSPLADPSASLRIHVVDWAVKPVHRQILVDSEFLADILGAVKILEESFGHTVAFVTLYLRAREFHVQTEELSLWFDRALPLMKQFDHYRVFLRSIPLGSAEQYVDLRLHDRVIYR